MHEAQAAVGKCQGHRPPGRPSPELSPRSPHPREVMGPIGGKQGASFCSGGTSLALHSCPAYKEATGHPFKFLLPSWTFNPLSP